MLITVRPCHHSMNHPWVTEGGYSFQIWRVAANILTKPSRTADKGRSYSLKVWRTGCYKVSHRVSELDGFFGTI
jgi:hypothetical protein